MSATLSPDPPKVGQNVMEITVKAGDGAPVEGATVTVDAQMPMHGHSSSEKATVKDLGKGSYEAQPVTLQMPGKWEIKVTAKKGDDVGQTVLKLDVK